jgi:triphosphoribosyl-dephospho-CoA synthetase
MYNQKRTLFLRYNKGGQLMAMTAEEIKALPRTSDGVFDLNKTEGGYYMAAEEIYPVYAAFETNQNKKEGYPDIMAQMRVINKRLKSEFNFTNAAAYVSMLLKTIENISPEIYENYRELLDMFRETVKKIIAEYYNVGTESFNGSKEDTDTFCKTVREACGQYLLLEEKYRMCF